MAGRSAKYWLHVLTEIKNRGTKDCCILVCDGLSGLPDAVAQVWPATVVQTCIVHYAERPVMRNRARSTSVVAGYEHGTSVWSPHNRRHSRTASRTSEGRYRSGALFAYARTGPATRTFEAVHSLAFLRKGFGQGMSVAIMRTGEPTANRLSRCNAHRHNPMPHNRPFCIMHVMRNSS